MFADVAEGIFPVGAILGLLVAAAEPEGDCRGRDHRRDDDGEHDRRRIDEDLLLLRRDRSDRIEDAAVAGSGQQAEAGGSDDAPLHPPIVPP